MADSPPAPTPAGPDVSANAERAHLVVLAELPLVAETRLDLQTELQTPNDRWFIRDHYNVPRLDPSVWRLRVGGQVARPRQFSLDDVRSLGSRQLSTTMECAGNARSYLPPPTDGNPFKYGAVSSAAFTGVPLAAILAGAGLHSSALDVVFRGADRGFEKNVGREINFERSLPLAVAMHPDTLLVYEMNGEPLPVDHGYPLRLVVPGWYGVASVKWLTEIDVVDQAFGGYFQRLRYITPGGPFPNPLQERRVRSVITWPAEDSDIRPGPVTIRGLAWSGNQSVERVDFSPDGGKTWISASLDAPVSPYAWQRWNATWRAEPGRHVLQSRATDVIGRTQPERADWNFLGYANNGVQSVSVAVALSA